MKQHNYNISIPATIGDTIYLTNEEEKAKLPLNPQKKNLHNRRKRKAPKKRTLPFSPPKENRLSPYHHG